MLCLCWAAVGLEAKANGWILSNKLPGKAATRCLPSKTEKANPGRQWKIWIAIEQGLMADAWNTRDGQADDRQLPKAGDDLAAAQRQAASPGRSRASVEQAEQQQQAERLAELEERSKRQRALDKLARPWLWVVVLILLVLTPITLTVLPLVKEALTPPLSISQLNSQQDTLQLQAESRLGAAVKPPAVKKNSQYFILTYRVKAGSKLFQGGVTTSSCRLIMQVSRINTPHAKLIGQVVSQQGCFKK